MKDIYICATVYHLLIALVKQLINDNHADLIICKRSNISPITLNKIQASKIFNKVFIYDNIEPKGYQIGWLEKIFQGTKKAEFFFISTALIKNEYWQNSKIYIFNDNSFFGQWFNQFKIPYHLLEDGLNHYSINPLKKQQSYTFINKWLGTFCGHHGFSSQMIDLEVNSIQNMPSKLQKKAKVVSRKQLFDKLSQSQKKLLIDLFDLTQISDITNSFSNKTTTLLITQPLAEDFLISHDTKIRIYKKLIENYAQGQIFIKPHPRESENYKKIFPDCIIIDKSKIPIELFDFFPDFHFTYGITAFSTSLDSLTKIDHKIFMGYDWTINQEREP